jgi:HK97 family phage major capsid protein
MSTRLETLRSQLEAFEARQAAVKSELTEIVSRDGAPTEDEATQTRSLVAEFEELAPKADELRNEIARLTAILNAPERAREVSSPTILTRQADPLADENVQYLPTAQVRGAARTAIENLSQTEDHVRDSLYRSLERADDARGTLARHMIAASRVEYRSAFSKLISGTPWALTPDEVRAVEHVRAASLTDASGGYAVPTVLDPTLILTGAHDGLTPNPIRQLANVRQITGDNLNLVRTDGVTASYVAEATESTDGAPTLNPIELTPHKAHAAIPFTIEIQGDWASMESEMRRLLMVAKDDLEIEKFTLGTGSVQPTGLVYDIYTNYSGQVQASATADTFAIADIYALVAKIADRFRGRSSFIGNELTFDRVRQFNMTGGASMWTQLDASRPATILGRPAYGLASMDGVINAGAENYMLLFGDIREAYTIVDRVGMTVELVNHLFGTTNNLPNGMRALYAYWRNGARVVNSGAVGLLNVT